ncbi:MAG: signal peptidase I [Lachnospiraceae bacterium]|nr:signal peptidase I [Lachnospiraceae bacterium]
MAKKKSGLSFIQKEKKFSNETITEIISWIGIFVFAIFLAYVAVRALGTRIIIAGDSMEPSLYNRQVVYVDKVTYSIKAPSRDDVVVFSPNGNRNQLYSVKRVVAIPGDTVEISGGILYVNGEEEDRYSDAIADAGIAADEVTLGEDEFFVMGDNPNSSEDSRSANIGPVLRSQVEGKAWLHMAGGGMGIGRIR